jgi:hypothetical protein
MMASTMVLAKRFEKVEVSSPIWRFGSGCEAAWMDIMIAVAVAAW